MHIKGLLIFQTTLLISGTTFAWYTVYTDFVAFFAVYDSLFRFADCIPPNPLAQACFYGAFAFLIALIWSVRLYQGKTPDLYRSQRYLVYLLIASTIFGWSNFTYMLYSATAPVSTGFTCVIGAETNPFTTPCFIGSVFFTLSLFASLWLLRSLRRAR